MVQTGTQQESIGKSEFPQMGQIERKKEIGSDM